MCDSCSCSGIGVVSGSMDTDFVPPSSSLRPPTPVASDPPWKKDRLRLAELMIDLDRCEHGRHAKDICFSCQREYSVDNTGNTCLEPGERIGTNINGDPIVVPEWKDRYDPDAWTPSE